MATFRPFGLTRIQNFRRVHNSNLKEASSLSPGALICSEISFLAQPRLDQYLVSTATRWLSSEDQIVYDQNLLNNHF
jgi:hypothetical protein